MVDGRFEGRSQSPLVHTSYGRVDLSFREPTVRLWFIVVVGSVILLAAISSLVWILSSDRGSANADLLAVTVTLSVLSLGSLANVIYSVYCLMFPGYWHLTQTHLYKIRGTRMLRVLELGALPQPHIAPLRRYGWTIAVWVRFGGKIIVAPNLEVANALVTGWKAKNL